MCTAIRHGSAPNDLFCFSGKSVPGRGRKLFHQGIDFACRYRHDDTLNGPDFFVCDLLFPGNAKVVFDSWLTLSGYGRSQTDNCCRTGVKMFVLTNGIVEIAVCRMLIAVQHNFLKKRIKIRIIDEERSFIKNNQIFRV
jgi:hypothetical protein